MANREKYKEESLRDKMQKITKAQKKEDYTDEETSKKKTKLNCIGYPHNDPYGLSEAWWKVFTKPKVI